MLIECPECQLQISNKAISCPHCGYPMKPSVQPLKKPKRLPNGFGQITKISKKGLRKPYRVMVTIGKTELGKPICKLLKPESYFESYNDAYKALIEYNKNPYDFGKDMTIGELHDLWWESTAVKNLTDSTRRVYNSAWMNHCSEAKNIMLSEFRLKTLRTLMEDKTPKIKKLVKVVFLRLFDYAVQYEIIEKNIIRDFKIEDDLSVKKDHIIFTEAEMKALWDRSYMVFVDWVLIQCYTGMRPQELCNIKIADVDLDRHIMYGGMKTKAGKNRAIPIADKIYELVKKNYEKNKNNEYLFTYKDKKIEYKNYWTCFQRVIKELDLNPEHRPHDPRKQFVTMAKSAGLNEYAIKRIVGHHISDITENVYTERDLDWLVSEVNKI